MTGFERDFGREMTETDARSEAASQFANAMETVNVRGLERNDVVGGENPWGDHWMHARINLEATIRDYTGGDWYLDEIAFDHFRRLFLAAFPDATEW